MSPNDLIWGLDCELCKLKVGAFSDCSQGDKLAAHTPNVVSHWLWLVYKSISESVIEELPAIKNHLWGRGRVSIHPQPQNEIPKGNLEGSCLKCSEFLCIWVKERDLWILKFLLALVLANLSFFYVDVSQGWKWEFSRPVCSLRDAQGLLGQLCWVTLCHLCLPNGQNFSQQGKYNA